MNRPEKLFHGSSREIEGALEPVLIQHGEDQSHTKPAVFATDNLSIAALFMFPINILSSIGFEQNIAYICIWGKSDDFRVKDVAGFMYTLPSESFEKVGKAYEWQSFESVIPTQIKSIHRQSMG